MIHVDSDQLARYLAAKVRNLHSRQPRPGTLEEKMMEMQRRMDNIEKRLHFLRQIRITDHDVQVERDALGRIRAVLVDGHRGAV